ncbi:YiaA/YiaB family inner membrane protein, partial [Yersinia pestis]
NATLALSEKGFYGVTFFMTLFGAIAVQKNTRDSAMSSDTESASLFKKVRDQLKAED